MRGITLFVGLSGLLAACTPSLLPHSVRYLEGLWETAQVWRLDANGETSAQVTHEEFGVQGSPFLLRTAAWHLSATTSSS